MQSVRESRSRQWDRRVRRAAVRSAASLSSRDFSIASDETFLISCEEQGLRLESRFVVQQRLRSLWWSISVEGRDERTGLLHFTVQCGALHFFWLMVLDDYFVIVFDCYKEAS